ncbi:MAG: pyrroline-5-carboxylate reductase [Gammaproteobacteria bacterium]|nr:pyrroline-5-carboxylate reductase [Gammaproteobacteria bacterium]
MSETLPGAIAFIGGGNMARALIAGLIASGCAAPKLRVSEPDRDRRAALARDFPGLTVVSDNQQAAAGADCWILAVKPQQMAAVASGLAPLALSVRPLVVSLAAGVRIGTLNQWLGRNLDMVRSMPNRAAMFRAGITGLCAAPGTTGAARSRAEELFQAVGDTVWLERESDMDAVTAISGSGPAYVFLLIEMLEAAAVAEGLAADVARRLALATVVGAAVTARGSTDDAATLRAQVTSPGGTTAAALAVLEAADLRGIFLQAVHAGRRRAAELAAATGG